MCTDLAKPGKRQCGVSLIELILFIVIISVSLVGILGVMNLVTFHSGDPMLHKQALAAAESLMEEIELQDFVSQSGVTSPVTQANRATQYHIVTDYNGFATNGIYPMSGAAVVPGLGGYSVSVAVTGNPLGSIAAGSAVLITVRVTNPQATPTQVQLDGFRASY